jgi:hypothetical protein
MSTQTNSNLQALKKSVQQLRREATITRNKVSLSCKELISYCEANKKNDVLVHGFKTQKHNPFKEETGCSFL